MTSTDVLISTDADGTEHWEHQVEPTLATDIVNVGYSLDIEPGYPADEHWGLAYPDGTSEGTSYDLSGNWVLSYRAYANATEGFYDSREYVGRAVYYDPLLDLPEGAVMGAWRYELAYASVTAEGPGSITLALDLWEGVSGDNFRPLSVSDHATIDALRTTSTGVQLIDPYTLVDGDAPSPVEWSTPILTDAQTTITAYTTTWCVRQRLTPWPVDAVDDGDAGIGIVTLLDRFNPWQADSYNPRVMIEYTLPGTTEEIPPPRRIYHNAKRILAAQRQQSIIVGRRPS